MRQIITRVAALTKPDTIPLKLSTWEKVKIKIRLTARFKTRTRKLTTLQKHWSLKDKLNFLHLV